MAFMFPIRNAHATPPASPDTSLQFHPSSVQRSHPASAFRSPSKFRSQSRTLLHARKTPAPAYNAAAQDSPRLKADCTCSAVTFPVTIADKYPRPFPTTTCCASGKFFAITLSIGSGEILCPDPNTIRFLIRPAIRSSRPRSLRPDRRYETTPHAKLPSFVPAGSSSPEKYLARIPGSRHAPLTSSPCPE